MRKREEGGQREKEESSQQHSKAVIPPHNYLHLQRLLLNPGSFVGVPLVGKPGRGQVSFQHCAEHIRRGAVEFTQLLKGLYTSTGQVKAGGSNQVYPDL